jgi:hypothetical protein
MYLLRFVSKGSGSHNCLYVNGFYYLYLKIINIYLMSFLHTTYTTLKKVDAKLGSRLFNFISEPIEHCF